jgi:Protein of unknown function (DUF1097)
MAERMKGLAPLAIAVGVLAFLWCELALNFTFHWVTSGDLGNGLHLPSNFHLIVPAAFVSWGMFFAAGADNAALRKVSLSVVVGAVGALLLMVLGSATAGLPDFWGLSLWVGILALGLVLVAAAGDGYFTPAAFGGFACVVFWWLATGLDGWADKGGGVGNSVKALGDPATAGAGAFGGVLSTPYGWVFVNITVSLVCGCLLGALSVRLAGVLTPKPQPARSPGGRGAAAAG